MSGTNFGIYRPPAGAQSSVITSVSSGEINMDLDEQLKPAPLPKIYKSVETEKQKEEKKKQQIKLNDYAMTLSDYTPTLPDHITNYYLRSAGLNTQDVRVTRLASISTLKHISDIVDIAYVEAQKQQGDGSKPKLTLEVLKAALDQFGIKIVKPPSSAQ